MRRVYVDNNATTPMSPAVLEAMIPFFAESFGNPSSKHGFGAQVSPAMKKARESVRALVDADGGDEILFTSGGTESDNAAILSALGTQCGRDEVITSVVEHPAILSLCEWLREERGIRVHYIPVDSQGNLDRDAYRNALSSRTAVCSFMWANNETGVIFPIEELAQLAHQAGAIFHSDAVQAVGKVPLSVGAGAIDMLSISAHKIHGPKGVGALYVRRGVAFRGMIRGGRQERARRAGTENVPGIVGLGRAAELASSSLERERPRIEGMRDRLESGLLARLAGSVIVGDRLRRLPNTSLVAVDSVQNEDVLRLLDRAGVAASSGSACSSGTLEPSHVLRAMGLPDPMLGGAIRFSFSGHNTDADVDAILELMPQLVAKLRTPPSRRSESSPSTAGFGTSYG